MSEEPKRITRLKHDTQPIPDRLKHGANEIQAEQLKLWERQLARNNQVADVLNQQSEMIESIRDTVEPMAKTMAWMAYNKQIAGYLLGWATSIGVVLGALLGLREVWKWLKGIP